MKNRNDKSQNVMENGNIIVFFNIHDSFKSKVI